MTVSSPAFYALVSCNGESRYEFQPCGGNQAYCRRYVKADNGEWALLSSGCNWIGIMMNRYNELMAKGFKPSF